MGLTHKTRLRWTRSLLLGLLALVALPRPATAQDVSVHPDYTVKRWTSRDGLPVGRTLTLHQSSDGYLWLGTIEGLVRFDGHRFTVFNASNTPALSNNRVTRLDEGPPGYLWITTEPGSLVLYHDERFTLVDEAMIYAPYFHKRIALDADTAWVATQRGILRFAEGRLHPYRQDVLDTVTSSVARDVTGRLWVGSQAAGLYRFEHDGSLRHFTMEDGLPSLNIANLLADRRGGMWVQLNEGGTVRILGDHVVTRLLPPDTQPLTWVTPQYQDETDAVWFAVGEAGWWRLNPSGRRTVVLPTTPRFQAGPMERGPDGQRWRVERTSSAPKEAVLLRGTEAIFRVNDEIRTFRLDPSGRVWIAAGAQGLFLLRPKLLQTLSEPEGLHDVNIYSILEDENGTIWVGGYNEGLERIDSTGPPVQVAPPRWPSGEKVSPWRYCLHERWRL